MTRIALTGANGYIASMIRLYNKDEYEFVNVTRKDVDFSKPETVADYFETLDFDCVVHTAANAQTAFCAENPELSHKINCESAIEIAKVCQKKGAKYIFISTEQVFNGRSDQGPFTEADTTNCVTDYGLQKLEVEDFIKKNLTDYCVLRLSSQVGLPLAHIKVSTNFIAQTLKAMRTKTPTLFTVNELRGITYVQRIADQFTKILELPSDIYHLSSYNDKNTYEVCKYIAKQFGYSQEEIDQYILPNTERYKDRFRDYRMNSDKIQSFGFELGTMEEDIDLCLKDFGWL